MKNSFASTVAKVGFRPAPVARWRGEGPEPWHRCVGQPLGKGGFQFLKGFPVQTGQRTKKAVILQGALEIQHVEPQFTGSKEVLSSISQQVYYPHPAGSPDFIGGQHRDFRQHHRRLQQGGGQHCRRPTVDSTRQWRTN
jgi:hypothetical protein